jgi:hypothetical protein
VIIFKQCSDIQFAPNGDSKVKTVDGQNCYNSTDITIAQIFTTTSLTG